MNMRYSGIYGSSTVEAGLVHCVLPPAVCVWLLLAGMCLAHDKVVQKVESALKPLLLNQTQLSLLHHFAKAPEQPWTISALVKVMAIHQPGITKACRALVERGALRREVDEQDSRVKHLFVTQAGLTLLQQAQALLGPVMVKQMGCLDEGELSHLSKVLQKLIHNVEGP